MGGDLLVASMRGMVCLLCLLCSDYIISLLQMSCIKETVMHYKFIYL